MTLTGQEPAYSIASVPLRGEGDPDFGGNALPWPLAALAHQLMHILRANVLGGRWRAVQPRSGAPPLCLREPSVTLSGCRRIAAVRRNPKTGPPRYRNVPPPSQSCHWLTTIRHCRIRARAQL